MDASYTIPGGYSIEDDPTLMAGFQSNVYHPNSVQSVQSEDLHDAPVPVVAYNEDDQPARRALVSREWLNRLPRITYPKLFWFAIAPLS